MGLLALTTLLVTQIAAPEKIIVDPGSVVGHVDEHIYGQFLEHIYNSVVDGLWGQLVRGPSFEEPPTGVGKQWTIKVGPWRAVGDEICVPGVGVDNQVFAGNTDWTDYIYRVEARKDGGQEGFLILFCATDEDNFYWWNLGGWGNTYSAVEHEVAGQRSLVGGTRTETKIDTGKWYEIEIRVRGKQIECLLDGKQLCAFEDVSNGHGKIGLGSWATEVRYRNATVMRDGAPLFKMEPAGPIDTVSALWEKEPKDDPTVLASWTETNPLNSSCCQRIKTGENGGGIAQRGLAIEKGVQYTGSVWLRGKGKVAVALQEARQLVDIDSPEWREVPLSFTPTETADGARLDIRIEGPGEIWVDQCTLRRADTPYRSAIYERVKALRPMFIRWPGGCYAEYYRWKDAIGPAKDRVTKPNTIWGGLDPNDFGTAEFVQLCHDLGAAPLFVLNIGHHETPEKVGEYVQEALDWVEYCNGDAATKYGALRAAHGHPDPFNVVIWEIGNETWSMGVEAYAQRAKLFVDALRKKDPHLKFLVCGSAGLDLEWNRRILELAATHMDFLSVHHYMEGTFEQEMKNGVDYPEFLNKTGGLIARGANPKIKIAVTEWNQQSVALRTGLYAGLVLNGFERYGNAVAMSCPALFIRKTDATAWDNALINHDSNRVFVAPNYLVMKLYHDHFAPDLIAVTAPQSLNVVATRNPESNTVTLKVVNPSPDRDVTTDIEIAGTKQPEFKAFRVWSPDINDKNTLDQPDKIQAQEFAATSPVAFPAHSVTVLDTRVN